MTLVLVTVAVLSLVFVAARWASIPFTTLTKDPTTTLGAPWYVGALSNATILILVSSGVVALFSAHISPRYEGRSIRGLLAWLGASVVVLGLDDLYLGHEEIFPSIGVPDMVVYALYAVGLVSLLMTYGRVIVDWTNYILLLGGMALLGLSLAVDIGLDQDLVALPISGSYLEDPAKVAGVVLLAGYLIDTSSRALRSSSQHRAVAVARASEDATGELV